MLDELLLRKPEKRRNAFAESLYLREWIKDRENDEGKFCCCGPDKIKRRLAKCPLTWSRIGRGNGPNCAMHCGAILQL
jgi:hypothetical protein